jgi:hypothetical protein
VLATTGASNETIAPVPCGASLLVLAAVEAVGEKV